MQSGAGPPAGAPGTRWSALERARPHDRGARRLWEERVVLTVAGGGGTLLLLPAVPGVVVVVVVVGGWMVAVPLCAFCPFRFLFVVFFGIYFD